MRRYLLLACAAALLTACQPRQDEAAQKAEAPAPETVNTQTMQTPPPPSALVEPIVARGNEPFWAADADAAKLVLTRPDHPPLTFATIVERHGGLMIWSGRDLTLTVQAGQCSDGMSDQRYPMRAELQFAGETLSGCAFEKRAPPAGPAP